MQLIHGDAVGESLRATFPDQRARFSTAQNPVRNSPSLMTKSPTMNAPNTTSDDHRYYGVLDAIDDFDLLHLGANDLALTSARSAASRGQLQAGIGWYPVSYGEARMNASNV